MAMMLWPQENGSFPHLSGITFSVNGEIPTSVVLDELEEFVSVEGEYRVYDIKVLNRETGAYEPLELTETYTIASHNYALLEQGSGMKMLKNAVILQDDGLLDVEALERYIVEELGGVVGEEYKDVSTSITFTDSASCSMAESCPLRLYTDLTKSEWYHDGVHYCIERNIIKQIFHNGMQPSCSDIFSCFINDLSDISTAAVIRAEDLQIVFIFRGEHTSLTGRTEYLHGIAAFTQNSLSGIIDNETVESIAVSINIKSIFTASEIIESACFTSDIGSGFNTAAEKSDTVEITGKFIKSETCLTVEKIIDIAENIYSHGGSAENNIFAENLSAVVLCISGDTGGIAEN